MVSKFRRFFVVAVVFTWLLTACGGTTPAATHEVNPSSIPAVIVTDAPPGTEPPVVSTELPTATTEQTAAPVTSTGISYANDLLPILQSRCGSCHGTNNPREGLTVTVYDALMRGSKNGPVVKPGDPDASAIVKAIRDGEMPKRGPKLTPEQLQILVDWIAQGALNN